MDLWQLKVFCHVVEAGSFSNAGAQVHLSQPTVSSHIRDLEQTVGCRLIDRLPKKAVPTKAGALLYGYAKKLLALRQEAVSALAAFQGVIKGPLAVGGSTIPGAYLLPPAIGRFTQRHPGVKISLVLGDTAAVTEQILSGRLEMGVVGARSQESAIDQTPLLTDEMQVILPAHHRWRGREHISLTALAAEPFIIREPGSGTLQSIRQCLVPHHLSTEELTVVAEMGSTEAVRQAVKAGLGVSILSTLAVADDLAAGRVAAVKIDGVDLTRRFFLTRHKQRTPSPVCSAFIAFLNADGAYELVPDTKCTDGT